MERFGNVVERVPDLLVQSANRAELLGTCGSWYTSRDGPRVCQRFAGRAHSRPHADRPTVFALRNSSSASSGMRMSARLTPGFAGTRTCRIWPRFTILFRQLLEIDSRAAASRRFNKTG